MKTWSHKNREGAGRSSRTAMSKALKGSHKGKKWNKSALAVVFPSRAQRQSSASRALGSFCSFISPW